MASVLVLNATYEPLHIVSLRRAIVLLLKEKAEILEATDQRIRAAGFSLPIPSVIRLVYYVRVPRRISIPLSRRTVMMRDNYTCQYCGAQPSSGMLTIDHVLPKTRGGASSWDNMVCACQKCNLRKGCRTPQEAGMPLRAEPKRPEYVAMVIYTRDPADPAWSKYIPDLDDEKDEC
jgi:5-methylcytosine-specific restriction endonuclease McrA